MPFVDYIQCKVLQTLLALIPIAISSNPSGTNLDMSKSNSIPFCNRSVFGYVSLGGCQAKSSQTDRHRIKSYTFLYFKHQSYTK